MGEVSEFYQTHCFICGDEIDENEEYFFTSEFDARVCMSCYDEISYSKVESEEEKIIKEEILCRDKSEKLLKEYFEENNKKSNQELIEYLFKFATINEKIDLIEARVIKKILLKRLFKESEKLLKEYDKAYRKLGE
jgi:hypothetical protein